MSNHEDREDNKGHVRGGKKETGLDHVGEHAPP